MSSIYLSDHIGLTKGQIVAVFAISGLLNMVVTITVGAYSDRMRSKKLLAMLAAIICMVGLLFYMRADSFEEALVSMSIASAPSGLIMGQMFAMSRLHFTKYAPDLVEMCLIWLRSSLSVGFFVGLLIGANLYVIATFQGVLWGNFCGYAILLVLLLIHNEYRPDREDGTKNRQPSQVSGASGEPFSLMMLFAILLLACADAIRGLYLPLVVKETFGRAELMSYLWSIQAIFELLFMTLAGYWAMRYGTKKVLFIGGLCAIIGYIVYSATSSLPMFFLIQPIYSLFVSIKFGVAMGYVQRMFVHRSGFGASLYEVIMLMATLVGYLLPLFIKGYHSHLFFIPMFIVATSLALIGLSWMKERKRMTTAGTDFISM
ncbi:hypothetical protein L3i20_v240310 [Paenibacillus sp. L3-i20]|nr:hypothetical protein L3i20_v240310 [Paenibacillus sp. L3-i20]